MQKLTPYTVSKVCSKCGIRKMKFEFYNTKKSSDGKMSSCINCRKKYYQDNKDKIAETNKKYVINNRESVRAYKKKYREENRKKLNQQALNRQKQRSKKDPLYHLKRKMGCRVRHGFRLGGLNKKNRTETIVGCSWQELYNHLATSFEANYGIPREWMHNFDVHIDHIIPINTAKTEEGIIRLNHYTNLQILMAEDNRSKTNKLDWSLDC